MILMAQLIITFLCNYNNQILIDNSQELLNKCKFKFFISEINCINNKKILLFIGQIYFCMVFRTVKSTKNFIADHDT